MPIWGKPVCFVKCCFLFTSVNGWRWKSHFFVSLLDGPLSQLLPISLYDFVSGGHYTLKISKPMVNTQQTLRGFQKTKCAGEDLWRGKYYAKLWALREKSITFNLSQKSELLSKVWWNYQKSFRKLFFCGDWKKVYLPLKRGPLKEMCLLQLGHVLLWCGP